MEDVPAAARRRDLPLAVRCRLAFLEGVAEAGVDAEQLRRALARYPGDRAATLTSMDREQAWDAILTRLPEGWRAGRPSYNPGRRLWDVAAIGPKRGGRHGAPPEIIVGEGPDELAALVDLAERLGRH